MLDVLMYFVFSLYLEGFFAYVRIGTLWAGHEPGAQTYLTWLLNVIVNRNSTTLPTHMGVSPMYPI